tara:strand:+ start:486 stop:758 length:273 start_codon:yes stop_codon:yes gene_type:complete
MYYVYVLINEKHNIYIGFTNDLKRRVHEHKTEQVYSTKRIGGNWQLIYYEACRNKKDAFRRERFYKNGPGRNQLIRRIKHDLQSINYANP